MDLLVFNVSYADIKTLLKLYVKILLIKRVDKENEIRYYRDKIFLIKSKILYYPKFD